MKIKFNMKKGFKGSVTVFLMILVGLIIGMYLFGYSSIAMSFIGTNIFSTDKSGNINENMDAGTILNNIKDTLLSPFGISVLGMSSFFGVLSGIGGGGIGYASGSILAFMLPAFLLFMIANIFFFPIVSEATQEGLPEPINILLMLVYNVLLLLTILTWVGGRD
jgi:hypothetical protein